MYTINETSKTGILVGVYITSDKVYHIYWNEAHHIFKISFFTVEAVLNYLSKIC